MQSLLVMSKWFNRLSASAGAFILLLGASLEASTFSRVSVGPGGIQANGSSLSPALSENGRIVVFRSDATNLDPRCTNGVFHVYAHDRWTGTTTCVSINSNWEPANLGITSLEVSGDGRVIAFATHASNLDGADTNGLEDIFIHHRLGGTTRRVTNSQPIPGVPPTPGGATNPVLSGDGRFLSYVAFAPDVPNPGSRDVYLYDDAFRTTIRVNRAVDGTRGDGSSGGYFNFEMSNWSLFPPGLSDDGRLVSFVSDSSNLVPGDSNLDPDVFVFDRVAGTTTRVSVDVSGGESASGGIGSSLSADGRAVTFATRSPLVPSDVGGVIDVYVHDRFGATALVSRGTGGGGGNAASGALQVSRFTFYFAPALSRDGRVVAFVSQATDIVSGCEHLNGSGDLFVHDRATATTVCVTRGANGGSHPVVDLSASGRGLAFSTSASNLVPGVSDTNQLDDIIVVDLDLPAETPLPADFDGDGRSDVAVFLPSSGTWVLTPSDAPFAAHSWGDPALGDAPVAGDYDGDGRADLAVFRQSTGDWIIGRHDSTVQQVAWGAPVLGDVPVPSDYDGDGRTNVAVYRRTTGEWFIRRDDGGLTRLAWGGPAQGDRPVPADYDGDGRADIAVYRPSTGEWFVLRSSGGSQSVAWGSQAKEDVPVPADYDGDGFGDVAVFRPSGAWFLLLSRGGTFVTSWGTAGDVATPADYDGDGKADIAVYRPSTGEWFVRPSSLFLLSVLGAN